MEKIINNLIEVADKQSKNIDLLSHDVEHLADQIEQRPTKKKVYRLLGIVVVVVSAVVLLFNYLAYQSSVDTLDTLKSCIDPSGECAQQTAANNRINRGKIICNQEKVLYIFSEGEITPLPFCAELINAEIKRLGAEEVIPLITVDPNIEQIPAMEADFIPR